MIELVSLEGEVFAAGPCVGYYAWHVAEGDWLYAADGSPRLWTTGGEWAGGAVFAAHGCVMVPVHEEAER